MKELGPTISAGTREEAAQANIVFVAMNWSKLPTALAGLPAWNGRTVIDANNSIEAPLFRPAVKAFNHLEPATKSRGCWR